MTPERWPARWSAMMMLWWSAIAAACCASRAFAVQIEVGYVEARPGDRAVVTIALHTEGAAVAGIQNDIGFDAEAAIAFAPDGMPDCQPNATIGKTATLFAFQPPGCQTPETCRGIRAIVLAFDNVDPIPDGSVLYTCQVAVEAAAPADPHYLPCSRAAASDPEGGALQTSCRDGEVLLPGGSPRPTLTRTPTPTWMPTDTPLPTRAPRTAEPSGSRTPLSRPPPTSISPEGDTTGFPVETGSGNGGCAVVAPVEAGWRPFLPPLLLLLRRRIPFVRV